MDGLGRQILKDAVTAMAVVGTVVCASQANAAPADARIRSDSAAINAAIEHATERSVTFRQMVQRIEDSDSIVILMEGDCGHDRHACFTNVTTAGSRRIMWVTIDLRRADADADVMASIAHELRHTIEVIGAPGVRTFGDKFGLYTRIGFHASGGGFETLAAMDAGNAVVTRYAVSSVVPNRDSAGPNRAPASLAILRFRA